MFNTAFCSNGKTIKTATNSSRINTNFKKLNVAIMVAGL